MREYNTGEYKKKRIFSGWSGVGLGVVALGLAAAAFTFMSYKLEQQHLAPKQPSASQPSVLANEPPDFEEYEFHKILSEEEAFRLEEDEDFVPASNYRYFIRVFGFETFEEAQLQAGRMVEWGVTSRIRIKPYTADDYSYLLFRIDVGPYLTRSEMQGQRDILYDNELVNEGVIVRKN